MSMRKKNVSNILIEYLSYFDTIKIFINNENKNTDVPGQHRGRAPCLSSLVPLNVIKNAIKENSKCHL